MFELFLLSLMGNKHKCEVWKKLCLYG